MVGRLGVLVIHGMGLQGPDFASELILDLDREIASLGHNPRSIAWKPVHWAHVLQPKEDQLWFNLSQAGGLNADAIRRFVISAFGDAVAYRREPEKPSDVYRQIHGEVHRHLRELREDLGGRDCPLVILAHSLGAHIISNYIWDEQTGKGLGGAPLERMETLALLVTFGCNIPLFTLALDHVQAIDFPPPTLPETLRGAARWLNFYDRDDVLAYPLKPLSASYNRAVTRDVEINAGNLFTSQTLLSHGGYWRDPDFIGPVARNIADILGRLDA